LFPFGEDGLTKTTTDARPFQGERKIQLVLFTEDNMNCILRPCYGEKQNPEFRESASQNERAAAAAFTDFCFSFPLDSEFWILDSAVPALQASEFCLLTVKSLALPEELPR
jgi:hypothetical protein